MVSNNIPTQHLSSLIMKQKYLMDDNGETNVNYCIDFGSKQYFRNILIPFLKQNIEFLKDYFLPSELSIGKSCLEYKDLEYHLVEGEGKFFTKTSAYSNTQELMQARNIATQDYFRFALDKNLLNTTTCPKLQNTFDFLNMNQAQFLKSFVSEGYSLTDIYAKQRPDLPSIEQQLMNKALSLEEEDEEESYDSTVITETSNWIDNALKTLIGYNSNIVFKQTANCSEASLVIIPGLDWDSGASDLLLYENDNKIVTQKVELVMPTTSMGWSETMHSIAHIYEDHYNENGLYQTDKNQLELYQSFNFGSALNVHKSGLKSQSLLPHDIEVLNLEYPPKAKNITFELNNLKTHFGYDLVNKGLVTLANVGNTAIDASDIKSYSIDLQSEHLSNITSSDNINFSFLLSYRTEISQIKLDQTGSITLSDNFRTSIILSPGCYDIVLHGDFYQSDIIMNLENEAYMNELPKHIDVYNYNSLIHSIDFE